MKASGFAQKYGPYALVAGGSDGLGAEFAEGIARRGVNLVLIARNVERLEATAARIAAEHGVDVVPVAADMADFESVAMRLSALKTGALKVGAQDVETMPLEIGLLVYDAAFAPIGPFADANPDDLAQAAAVNVRSPLLLARLLAAPMIERGRGGIVFMSSLAGGQGGPNLAAYAATKAFTTVLAEGLWHELRPRGVDVLVCTAGAIVTPGYRGASGAKAVPGILPADVVAETALRALGRGPVVIPGATNKLGRFVMTRLLSRRGAIALMAKNTGGLQ